SAAGRPSQLRQRVLRILEGPAAPPVRLTRRGNVALGATLAAACALLGLAGKPAAEEMIVGQVVDGEGRPLKGVEVRAYSYDDHKGQALRTDAQGRVQVPKDWFTGDDPRKLIVRPDDYRLGWYCPSCNHAVREKPGDFRITVLPRTQTLQGTLIDSKGQPLAGVPVLVQSL